MAVRGLALINGCFLLLLLVYRFLLLFQSCLLWLFMYRTRVEGNGGWCGVCRLAM